MRRARRARRRELSFHCGPGSAIQVGSRRNHEQRLQHERRGVRFTPGRGREPTGSLGCRTITQHSERRTAVHPFRHAILLGSAPPPAQGALGIVTSRRRSPGSGTASPRRIYECLTIECTRAGHITAMPGRRSYREQPMGPAKSCGLPIEWGAARLRGRRQRPALARLAAELALAVLPAEGPAGVSGDDVSPPRSCQRKGRMTAVQAGGDELTARSGTLRWPRRPTGTAWARGGSGQTAFSVLDDVVDQGRRTDGPGRPAERAEHGLFADPGCFFAPGQDCPDYLAALEPVADLCMEGEADSGIDDVVYRFPAGPRAPEPRPIASVSTVASQASCWAWMS